MKISLSWILDHIKVDRREVDVPTLLSQINDTTAEVDKTTFIKTDLSHLMIASLISSSSQGCEVEVPELKKKFSLPLRKGGIVGQWYLLKKEGPEYNWAMLTDIGSEKDGLMPSVWIQEKDIKGGWRDCFEQQDQIITISNTALTNRPDLWSHRGFAREVAALLQKELISEELIFEHKPIKHYDHYASANGSNPFSIEIVKQEKCSVCRRLAAMYISRCENRPSLLSMATRLARVDMRPIDALVDMTNYVMADIGQPMHAFDAAKIPSKKLVGRCAHEGEKIKLLGGEEVKLSSEDYVISDGERPLAVAGVMGGSETAVDSFTTSLLLESANFDPIAIRKTSTRLKIRSEGSTRHEKSLDPNQNTNALLRYLKLLRDASIAFEASESIVSLGPLAHEKKIEVSRALIESKIGIKVPSERVVNILTRLGFGIEVKNDGIYSITVPTYRATKDITIPEDIVEEVARFIGLNTIVPEPPRRGMVAFDVRPIERRRSIKKILAYGLALREVQTYAFYDEDFLRILNFDPRDALRVANPLSEHWQRLVTSLIPNLLKCVATNHTDSLRFFECNRVWFMQDDEPVEEQECAGIWYEHKVPIDFYEGKAQLEILFDLLKIAVRWQKPTKQLDAWYDVNQAAELWHGDRIIGRAGKMAPLFLRTIAEGQAFIFELDANFLCNYDPEKIMFKPLHKYPSTDLDISMWVPIECTVDGLEKTICGADKRITTVELIDSFEKPEWPDKKSITMRFTAYDPEGTLTKESIDEIWQHVVNSVTQLGAHIR